MKNLLGILVVTASLAASFAWAQRNGRTNQDPAVQDTIVASDSQAVSGTGVQTAGQKSEAGCCTANNSSANMTCDEAHPCKATALKNGSGSGSGSSGTKGMDN